LTRIIINKGPGLFELPRQVVTDLWDLHPELFDEPIDLEYLVAPGQTLESQYSWAVERNGLAHFLSASDRLRQLPWLITKVEAGEFGDDLRVVEVPDDIQLWYIQIWEDGSEEVHEEHRTFR
jgi:hypothetical protein